MYLPDGNVLLALAFDAQIHHPAAVRWLQIVTSDMAFTSIPEAQAMVLAGYL